MKHTCCSASRSTIESKTSQEKAKRTKTENQSVKFKEKMLYLPGGEFLMGTDDQEGFPFDGEGPVRKEEVQPFYIDRHTVTNAEFKQFVEETGYKTEAEHYGWSFVFYQFVPCDFPYQVQQIPNTPWWLAAEGVYWFQPEGPSSSIEGRMDHPVIHVSWNDAVAFCDWAGKRLPTEREWEYAARGGLVQKRYPWGDELTPNGNHYCNIWQGDFPRENTAEDGYKGTAPVQTFPPNGYGLYHMAGNVWEWCSDWFSNHPEKKIDPKRLNNQPPKVMRGGSYLCHKSYCNRYRVAARSSNTMDSSTGNIGFRCVTDGMT
ncbi:formylglycine-generating enzyme family protein [Halobacillus mangrovi]|uniref:formylglycine-generating enzyme family protein n=1 Tax=Halobacillus mangrovi TaxID=402384 RepID=UPI003D97D70A